jgi:hypothetical protein
MSRSAARDFYDLALRSFERACTAAGGCQDRHYEIGGTSFRLRQAGPALSPLVTPALGHLERAGEATGGTKRLPPELTILAWDSASTGTPLDHPWTDCPPKSPREVIYHHRDGVRILYDYASGILSLYDERQRTACYSVEAAERLSFAECSAPFRAIFQWWMRGRGRLLVHSAAVGLADGRGILIPGGEGAGKSTTAALCLRHCFRLVGDDFVVLSPGPPVRAESLYSSLKLGPESLARMADLTVLAREIGRPSLEKSVLYLSPAYQKSLAPILEIRAVLLPSLTGRDGTAIRPATPAEGIKALAPSTLYIQTGDQKEAFRILADLVRRIPCYTLELGRDFASVPAAIEEFLREKCT